MNNAPKDDLPQGDLPPVVAHQLAPGGAIPNHPHWPLLVYPAVVEIAGSDPAAAFEALFDRNRWPAAWRNGVYAHHHFHTTAHEALGVYSGEVTVQFGGDDGIVVTARPGDVIVLPAGMVTVSLMFPEPLAVKPVAPPACTAVYVAPLRMPGNVSATVAPTTLLGPALVTTMV